MYLLQFSPMVKLQHNMKTRELLFVESSEVTQIHQFYLCSFALVCLYLCIVLFNYNTHIDSCNHHNQDSELFHHHIDPLYGHTHPSFPLHPISNPWQPLIYSSPPQFCRFANEYKWNQA